MHYILYKQTTIQDFAFGLWYLIVSQQVQGEAIEEDALEKKSILKFRDFLGFTAITCNLGHIYFVYFSVRPFYLL
jgi:hypothetical protein